MFRFHSIIVLHLVLLCWNCLFIYATDTKPTCTDPAKSGALFSGQLIFTTDANSAYSLVAADINGDGYVDLVSASSGDNKIAWYQNLGDGKGTFSKQLVVTTKASGARSVVAADINGDGFLDLVSASYNDNKIAWYQNLDGKGTFSKQLVVTTNVNGAYSVITADINGDGYVDLVSASYNDNIIAWYQNLDGKGTFSKQIVVTTKAIGAQSVVAVDINGDGYVDLVSASYGDNKIAWYQNNGKCCPPGTSTTSNGTICHSCHPGYSSNTMNSPSCQECAPGKYFVVYNYSSGLNHCLNCTAGRFSAAKGLGIQCQGSCSAGKYSSDGQTSCKDCAADEFSSQAGSSICQNCPAGKSSSVPGALCQNCAAGKYSYPTSATSCVVNPTCTEFLSCISGINFLKLIPGDIMCATDTCQVSECCDANPTCDDIDTLGTAFSSSLCTAGSTIKNDLSGT